MAWTSPRTWVALETVTAALLNQHVRDNFKAIGDAWTSYVPTGAAAGGGYSLGNGVISGAYISVGKLTIGRGSLTLGSTTNVGSGILSFTLPVTAATSVGPVGAGWVLDNSPATNYSVSVILNSTTTIRFAQGGSSGGSVTGTSPIATPATSDVYSFQFCYEAA